MSQLMIDAQQVCKNYGRLEVLKGIDLQVPKGTVTCLIGPSGSGKSTMLRCVNHLEKVNAGRLYVDGDLIGYRERDGVLYEISEKDSRQAALRYRHGVPELQPLPPPHGDREHHRSSHPREEAARKQGPRTCHGAA